MTLSPGPNTWPKRSMRASPGGLRACCNSRFNERAPSPPRFIGDNTWMSRMGSKPKRFGMRSLTSARIPAAACLHEFAGRDQGRMADDRHRLAPTARLDLQHAEAGLRAVKHHPFDEPREDLAVLAGLRCCPRHPLMMARRRSGGYRMSWERGAPSPLATTLILIGA